MSKKNEELFNEEIPISEPGGDWVDYGFGASQKWEPKTIGDSISGIYKGLRRLEFLNPKTGELEPFYLGILQTDNGLRSIGGYVPVKNIFPTLPSGVKILLQYIGDIEIPKQPSSMKNYRYFVDGLDQEKVDVFRAKQASETSASIN